MNKQMLKKIIKSKTFITIIVVVVIIFGIFLLFFNRKPSYQFVTVTRDSVTESVTLTGNTTPAQSVSLSFGSSGIISDTFSDLGKQVTAGQVLAELNMNDLLAQLHSAQAGLVIAKQNASSSNNNIDNVVAEQNALVANAYRTLLNSTLQAQSISNLGAFDSPTVTGTYECGKDGVYNLKTYSSAGGVSIMYSGLEPNDSFLLTDVPRPLGKCGLYLSFDKSKILYTDQQFKIEIPNKNAANYNANQNAYQLALKTRIKTIAAAQANVAVPGLPSINDSEIVQAQASVDSALAKIKNAEIFAPITGTITQFDAKTGQLATPGTPLVSIMSTDGYEVDAGASETDVGKIALGNKVTMTLDALPNETFSGSVFYIAPAQTNTQGVITYQIKISFDRADPRFKSGFTANINIETDHKDNVLILPQYGILQNDQGTFVETLVNGKVVQNPVTLGIQDQKGNVEILSGVTEGEQVLNIGLKAQ